MWLEPIRQAVLGELAAVCGCARSAVIGGQWPQERLVEAGYYEDGRCQARVSYRTCACSGNRSAKAWHGQTIHSFV